MVEEWKKITKPDYSNRYEISNLGRVCYFKKGKRFIKKSSKNIKRYGYWQVSLWDGKSHHVYRLHRMVAEHFIPNLDNKRAVNHISGNKDDNSVSNLEWCTDKENSQHMVRLGLNTPPRGEKCGMSKIKEKDVYDIRKLHALGVPQKDMVKKFGIHNSTISLILSGQRWGWLK